MKGITSARWPLALLCLVLCTAGLISPALAQEASLKGIGRFEGWRDNALIGYGVVVGLSGSGDTRQNEVTRQALRNVLGRLGTTVTEEQISSRNVAVVTVTATLPASANVGDRISATVSSIGDARSLAGGTLLMTPMLGPDRRAYALAQGPLVTGGYSFESELNLRQSNYPTSARLEQGVTVEMPVHATLLQSDGEIGFFLFDPSFTTARRVAETINARFGWNVARAKSADEVRISYAGNLDMLTAYISEIENLTVIPDTIPRIVINERTGTVVAGSDVTISSVVVSQGDIRVTVDAENYASQPSFIAGFASDTDFSDVVVNNGIRSLVITNTDLEVTQGEADVIATFPNTTVADLVQGLTQAGIDTRRLISVLQAIKAAGALQAEIVVQ